MSRKLTLQDLVNLLSKKSKITKKDADAFLRELLQLVLERVSEKESVKIKDFGTFKLILINKRESVDVNTGEKIEIPAHYKFTFTPDKELKRLVNEPFSQLESVVLDTVDLEDPKSDEDATSLGDTEDIEDDRTEYVVDDFNVEVNEISPSNQLRAQEYPSFVSSQSYSYVYSESLGENSESTIVSVLKPDSQFVDHNFFTEQKVSQSLESELSVPSVSDDENGDIESFGIEQDLEEEAVNQSDDFNGGVLVHSEKEKNDTEYPLVQDTGLVHLGDGYSDSLALNKEEEQDVFSDDDFYLNRDVDKYVQGMSYHDYYKPSFASKLIKKLPFIIFGLIVFGFLLYNVISLFNVEYDFEKNIDRLSSTATSDSVDIIDEDVLDILLRDSVSVIKAYDVKNIPGEIASVASDSLNITSDSLDVALDSLKEEYLGGKISEKLEILVINKAQEYLQQNQDSVKVERQFDGEEVQDIVYTSKKAQYDVVSVGVTLRNLSTKHYGNPHYWVYIYQANKEKIIDPNLVPINTRVMIPDLMDFGVKDKEDVVQIKKAKDLVNSIS